VVRGGSWNNNPDNLRSSNRNRNEPDNRNNNIGFRVARVLSPASTLFFARAGAIKVASGVHRVACGTVGCVHPRLLGRPTSVQGRS
jgi:hypothetical protein